MRRSLLPFLACPGCAGGLNLSDDVEAGGEVGSGQLICERCGHASAVRDGIPRLLTGPEEAQRQTADSFSFKWSKIRSYGQGRSGEFQREWYLRKFGWANADSFREFLASRKRVLDVGVGTGHSPIWYGSLTKSPVIGLDISAGIEEAHRRARATENVHAVQGDLLHPPFPPASFDFIAADQVLPHLPDTGRAVASLARLAAPGAKLALYFYRKKGPVREFCDDYIRARTTKMSAEECWEFARQVTEFGRKVAATGATIELEEDLPILGIPKGKHDLQRLFFYQVFKCFWRDDWPYEENVLVNFDWYHPEIALRHSEEEVQAIVGGAGLRVERMNVEESGICVVASAQG